MPAFAKHIEELLAPRDGVIVDERQQPLFQIAKRLRDVDVGAFWRAKVVDEELLAQGAPKEVVLQAVPAPTGLPGPVLARALESSLVDHPRIQLTHSVALPTPHFAAAQPAEPSPLVPPLHQLPVCDEAGAVVFVKESSDGLPLLQWRQKRGSELALLDILDLADTVGEAIAALHRRGFANGALTPDTIVMQEMGLPVVPGEKPETVWVPKLVDVGLARLLASPGTWPSGASALWCPPEAFAPTATIDWRKVDQCAVAALLYALWTDQVPFDAIPAGTAPESAREARRKQIEALPPARGNNRARALGLTPAMSAACMRALSVDPNDRFPSLDAFTAALRSAARDANRRGPAEPDTTSPGSAVTSKFRALTQPPPTSGEARTADPETSQPRIQKGGALAAEDKPKSADAAAFDPNNSSPGPRSNVDAMLQKGRQRGAKISPLAPPVDDDALPEAAAALNAVVAATEPPAPRTPPPTDDAIPDERLRKIEEEEESEITSPLSAEDAAALAAAGGGDWKLNRLGIVLLVLWLGTLAWALTAGGGASDPKPGTKGSPTGFRTSPSDDK